MCCDVDYFDAVDDRVLHQRQVRRVDPNDLQRDLQKLDEEIAKHIREEDEDEIPLRLPSFYRSSNATASVSVIADYAYREPDTTTGSSTNQSNSHPSKVEAAKNEEDEGEEEVVRPFSADDEHDLLLPATGQDKAPALSLDAGVIAALSSPATKTDVQSTITSTAPETIASAVTTSPQRALSSSDLAVSQRLHPPTQTLDGPVRTITPTTRTGRSNAPQDSRSYAGNRGKGSASSLVPTTALSATGTLSPYIHLYVLDGLLLLLSR